GWYNNFKYTYSGNQLTKVTDAGTAARTNTFSYDANGNGITNSRLGISKIEYNHLNLPSKLVKGAENLVYSYDANGRKLTKTMGSAVTDYVDGIQYENGVLKFIQTEEGRILPNGSSYIYEYFLKDHLGNTRAVVDHSGTIKQIQDYYPFGMEMNQGNALNTASNLYKYNGKEKQVELGLDQLDYGARFYDAEIGRWNVVDPLAQVFEDLSPYNYGMNNPILMIDPDGMSATEPQLLPEVVVTPNWLPEITIHNNVVGESVWSRSIRASQNDDSGQSLGSTNQNTNSVSSNENKKNQEEGDDKKKPSLEDMKKNPPPESAGYKAPKSGARKARSSRGTGWVDKNGNIWVPDDHNGTHAPHWDVQPEKGPGYRTVYPTVGTAVKVGVGVAVGIAVWETVKWGVAILGAPETGGLSLGLLAIP
ncbi:RHS repeat-associated core domain-containing protein, partial [Sphingobacterium sp. InxBP1]|uniref:RHS repeat domain-containing protein n=1 Tax=Sphingobacterium sp. InxBP1 TaxID=2870328 RepID=UPI0022436076